MKRLIILATPRTGSRLVSSLLDSHPEISLFDEILTPHRTKNGDLAVGPVPIDNLVSVPGTVPFELVAKMGRAYYDWFFSQTVSTTYLGYTCHLLNNRQHTRWAMADHQATKVIVRRNNLLAQWVSWQQAMRDKRWTRLPKQDYEPAEKFLVRVPNFIWYVKQHQRGWDKVMSYCDRHQVPHYTVVYETLAQHRLQPLLKDLGLAPAALKSHYKKQADGAVKDRIANWEEVCKVMPVKYRHYLEMSDVEELSF